MKKNISIRVKPPEAADEQLLKNILAGTAGVNPVAITGFNIIKRSIDARSRQVYINLSLEAFINEPWQKPILKKVSFKSVHNDSKRVIIVGGGPAGMFAALRLLEYGIKPVILERGKNVRERRRDLALLNKEGILNPESNYCFGEGGAGTYSDGKLYTRSNKRGDINRILSLLVQFGAGEHILYESHPHIGTNKLPQIITAMRNKIIECGGEFRFEKKVTDIIVKDNRITKVVTGDGDEFEGDSFILATGHSARDIFFLLDQKKIGIEFKSFAMGVRIEHPQEIIDSIQYHCAISSIKGQSFRDPFLPPATYSLVSQVDGKGVFSFCMCPGGIIAPSSTNDGELVVNGWSPSKRNNPYANSGIVVPVDESDSAKFRQYGSLSGMFLQQEAEQKAFDVGGGKFTAPAQRMVDFCENKISTYLPGCSYLPGINSASLAEILPGFIYNRLKTAFKLFGEKMKGYLTNEATVVATESRTSSPVRIPRLKESLNHPQICNFYPCGEGAGYAGGIVSAAIDGENTATMIINNFSGEL